MRVSVEASSMRGRVPCNSSTAKGVYAEARPRRNNRRQKSMSAPASEKVSSNPFKFSKVFESTIMHAPGSMVTRRMALTNRFLRASFVSSGSPVYGLFSQPHRPATSPAETMRRPTLTSLPPAAPTPGREPPARSPPARRIPARRTPARTTTVRTTTAGRATAKKLPPEELLGCQTSWKVNDSGGIC